MIVEPEDPLHFLEQAFGTSATPLLLARDPESPTGWRQWTGEDAETLCAWLSSKVEEQATNDHHDHHIACYSAKQTSKRLGVSMSKLQSLLRRRDHPIPHIRDGRRIIIPLFLLQEWLREEAVRNAKARI